MMRQLKNQQGQSGLTLVETLVAITVLLVGVIGPLNIAARGISDGLYARNQITANYLAQEALETIVNKRYALARQAQYLPPDDTNSQPPYTIFDRYVDQQFELCINYSQDPNRFCFVRPRDTTTQITGSCNANEDYESCKVAYNKVTGFYQLPDVNSAGPIFTRKVKMVRLNQDEVKVIVTVEWYNKQTPKSLTIVEHLFAKG